MPSDDGFGAARGDRHGPAASCPVLVTGVAQPRRVLLDSTRATRTAMTTRCGFSRGVR